MIAEKQNKTLIVNAPNHRSQIIMLSKFNYIPATDEAGDMPAMSMPD
uniref:Uncharacterized protein n=1 Tax=Anguilla anguilla TaxID=7936 RepID=A0A0E9Q150_ANGAN